MAEFVKKVGNRKYYQINNIRASGIIPYKFYRGEIYVLIANEYQNKKLVKNEHFFTTQGIWYMYTAI